MSLLKLVNVTKKYITENNVRYALDNVSFSLENNGLVAIVGKSGSGKSTIVNLISLLDKPDSGQIFFDGKSINKFSNKRKLKYHNQDMAIVFQHYQLLENETALFNVMLPIMMRGLNERKAKEKAIQLFESINIKKDLYNRKCKDLSGGEKQRVAILRSLINEPKILLADEPTGALDSKNSLLVMKLLKEISKTRLVIMVSHNMKLVQKFADQIITLKDGKVESNKVIRKVQINNNEVKKTHLRRKSRWVDKITRHNFIRRFKRNLLSIISLSICLISSMLIIGFSFGSESSIINRSRVQLDYGVAILYKENKQEIKNSGLSLVQMTRPSKEEMDSVSESLKDFFIELNYDTLIPPGLKINLGEETLEGIYYYPIHSYIDESIDSSLLKEGNFPSIDTLYEVVINQSAESFLKKKLGYSPLNSVLKLMTSYETHFYTDEEENPVITDIFVFQKEARIVGIIEEMDFLSSPKIYYSYNAMTDYLTNTVLNNLSSYYEYDVTWLDRLYQSSNSEELSSYSYRLFYKNIAEKESLEQSIKDIVEPFKIESSAIAAKDTLLQLVDAASIGMSVFLVIALIGSILILGIISFSSYSEERKNSAILTCLGASQDQITSIYLCENLFIGLIALLISLLSSPLLAILVNQLITSFTGFKNMIQIPLLRFYNYPFLFPLILLISTFIVCLFATCLPIFFSKKISLKEELKDE